MLTARFPVMAVQANIQNARFQPSSHTAVEKAWQGPMGDAAPVGAALVRRALRRKHKFSHLN
jgi:hypothetical protein